MTDALYWLTLTCLVTGLMWAPYILNRIGVRGLLPAMANPSPEDKPHSPWAERAIRAHLNNIESLPIFAAFVVVGHLTGADSALTGTAAMVYFFARLAHYVVYVAGVPVARTLAFATGWAAMMAIGLAVLGVV